MALRWFGSRDLGAPPDNGSQGTPFQTTVNIGPQVAPQLTIFTVYKPKSSVDRQAVWGNDNGGWDRFFYSYFSNYGDGIPEFQQAIGDQGFIVTGLTGSGSTGPWGMLFLGFPGVLLMRRRS